MRKPILAGAIAAGTLASALVAGAFAIAPAPAAVTRAATPGVPASIRPGTPMKAVGGRPGAASATISVTGVQSTNWAGYAASLGTTTFRFVSAHFNVPFLDCAGVTDPDGAFSSHWVGLDQGG